MTHLTRRVRIFSHHMCPRSPFRRASFAIACIAHRFTSHQPIRLLSLHPSPKPQIILRFPCGCVWSQVTSSLVFARPFNRISYTQHHLFTILRASPHKQSVHQITPPSHRPFSAPAHHEYHNSLVMWLQVAAPASGGARPPSAHSSSLLISWIMGMAALAEEEAPPAEVLGGAAGRGSRHRK